MTIETLGDLAARLAATRSRLTARLVSQGTRRVWRVSVRDGTGTITRECDDDSIVAAITRAVATAEPSNP